MLTGTDTIMLFPFRKRNVLQSAKEELKEVTNQSNYDCEVRKACPKSVPQAVPYFSVLPSSVHTLLFIS